MITFFVSIAILLGGYFLYGKLTERVFGIQPERKTPAYELTDGVDYVPMSWPKIFLIQFISIAGLGPIFGAIMGAVYGPVAFLWIVLGSILGGAVHDYLSGMMSLRNKGVSLPEVVGKYLGLGFKQFMRLFTVLLLILVGTVFVAAPAQLLVDLTGGFMNYTAWCIIIFIY
jgi:carbon starvation protein CstA